MLGPFSKSQIITDGTGYNYRIYSDESRWYRSETTPYKAPLPYEKVHSEWLDPLPNIWLNYPCNNNGCAGSFAGQWTRFDTPSDLSGSSMASVSNKTYAKLVGKISSGLMLGNQLATASQTRGMIVSILKALVSPMKAMSKVFHRYASAPKRKHLRHLFNQIALKDVPGLYLLFHFGVEPLMKDLYACFETLAFQSLPSQHYSQASKGAWSYTKKASGTSYHEYIVHFEAIARLGCTVTAKEGLIAQLNEVGLINPLQPAWEVLPFSFVVDWFYPVGRLIDSMTDFVHVNVTDCYQTWLLKGKGAMRYNKSPYKDQWRRDSAHHMKRTLLATPKFHAPPFRFPQQVSLVRMATALALVAGAAYFYQNRALRSN